MSRFQLGFLTALFLVSLLQDALGKDWLVAHWIDSRVTVPVCIIGLVLVVWTFLQEEKS